MINKRLLIEKLLEEEPILNHTMNRWYQSNDTEDTIRKETIFFAQILDLFYTDPELPVEQLSSFPASVILDYLIRTHRYYLSKLLPEIEQQLTQLSSLPGEQPLVLASVFSWLQKNMEKHFRIEEQSLFPYITDLEKVHCNEMIPEVFYATYRDFSVQRFIETHDDDVENKLEEIKKYIVRSLSTMEELFPYRILLLRLDELEKDLRLHARIEDEVLVPMALRWEKETFGQL
jgi:regulator of cell morphogenesis and NO signaling